nr:autotransporter assembly complex family protein [Rhizobium setariae]
MKFFEGDDEELAVSNPVSYTVELSGGDKELDEKLQKSSLLYQESAKPVSGDLGLVIKARDDRDRLLAALYEDARYGGIVTVIVDGTELDALPPLPTFARDKPVPVVIKVDPGPVFTVKDVSFRGDAGKYNPADYGLSPGVAAGSNLVVKAADKVVADLEAEGRPLAKLTERQLIADHATDTVSVVIGAEGGPVTPLGEISVSGSKLVNPEFITKWSRLHEGERYSPEEIKDASERLRKLGVFSSVAITKANQLDQSGQMPLAIAVADGKQRYFGAGAQISSIDGAGVLGYWGHRNLFGNAESLKISGWVSRLGQATDWLDLDYNASIVFSKPAAFNEITTFNAGVLASSVHPDSYQSAQVSAYANVAWELSKRDTVTAGTDFAWNQTEDTFGTHEYLIKSLPVTWARDASNDSLNPTDGYKFNLSTKPSYEFYYQNIFTSLEGSASGYYALDAEDDIVLAGKLSLGTLVGVDEISQIPATRRFYAGGGGSVRGYAFQEISPYNKQGDALGGRSYALTSLEARIAINKTFGVVPFLDVGTVGREMYPDFSDIRAGAGIGIRYATPFGPLRLDVAVPLNRYEDGSRFGIYAGIGQSF